MVDMAVMVDRRFSCTPLNVSMNDWRSVSSSADVTKCHISIQMPDSLTEIFERLGAQLNAALPELIKSKIDGRCIDFLTG